MPLQKRFHGGSMCSMDTLNNEMPCMCQSGNVYDLIMHRKECILKLRKDWKSQKSWMTATQQFSGDNGDIEHMNSLLSPG